MPWLEASSVKGGVCCSSNEALLRALGRECERAAQESRCNGERNATEESIRAPAVCAHECAHTVSLLVVVKEAEDVVVGEAGAAFEEVELDGDGDAGDDAAEALDELD